MTFKEVMQKKSGLVSAVFQSFFERLFFHDFLRCPDNMKFCTCLARSSILGVKKSNYSKLFAVYYDFTVHM